MNAGAAAQMRTAPALILSILLLSAGRTFTISWMLCRSIFYIFFRNRRNTDHSDRFFLVVTGVLEGPAGYRVTISYGVYPRCPFNINCQYIRLFPGADNIPLYSRIPAYAAHTPCHRQASASSVPPAESSIPAPLRN